MNESQLIIKKINKFLQWITFIFNFIPLFYIYSVQNI